MYDTLKPILDAITPVSAASDVNSQASALLESITGEEAEFNINSGGSIPSYAYATSIQSVYSTLHVGTPVNYDSYAEVTAVSTYPMHWGYVREEYKCGQYYILCYWTNSRYADGSVIAYVVNLSERVIRPAWCRLTADNTWEFTKLVEVGDVVFQGAGSTTTNYCGFVAYTTGSPIMNEVIMVRLTLPTNLENPIPFYSMSSQSRSFVYECLSLGNLVGRGYHSYSTSSSYNSYRLYYLNAASAPFIPLNVRS